MKLLNILFVPSIANNMPSVSKLTKDNHLIIEFTVDSCVVKDHQRTILLQRVLDEGLYKLILPRKGHYSSLFSSSSLPSCDQGYPLYSSSISSSPTSTISFISSGNDTKTFTNVATNCRTKSSFTLNSNKILFYNSRSSKSTASSKFSFSMSNFSSKFHCNQLSDSHCNTFSSSKSNDNDKSPKKCNSVNINANTINSILPTISSSISSNYLGLVFNN